MAGSDDPIRHRGLTFVTVLGLIGWVGATVLVAVRNKDPSDAEPMLHTAAIGGAIFFTLVFASAIVQLRRTKSPATERLYRRLVIGNVPPSALRSAGRTGRRIGYTYVVFGILVTGLALISVGLGDEQATRRIVTVIIVLVVVWAVIAVFSIGAAFRSADDMFVPLGLRLVATPTYVPNLGVGGGHLAGSMSYAGSRHGRQVTMIQQAKRAVTVVHAPVPARTIDSRAEMARLTGEPPGVWKGASLVAGLDGVTVTRRGNGAGRWCLYDLLLAEAVAHAPP